MAFSKIQTGFSAGEISPSLLGRVDLQKYSQGCTTLRNFFVDYRGGATSRAGLAYCGSCKQQYPIPPRLIKFQFNINQGYALEFGDQYMRVLSNGAYVTELSKNITGATKANPAVITIPSHGYSIGDWIYITGMQGMTEFNGLTWIVHTTPTTNTVTLTDLFGTVIDSSAFTVYTAGGTSARIYTAVAPYAAVDLPYLKFTQSADVMSLCCVNTATKTEYPPYDLERIAADNWVFTEPTFESSISAPTNVTSVATSSTTITTYYSYVVTAVDAITGEESVASARTIVANNDIAINAGSNTISWDSVIGAGSYNIYGTTPSYEVVPSIGSLYGFLGTSLGGSFTDTNITADFTSVPPTHTNPFARGTIVAVNPTAAGSGYTQDGISYTITTSTGSGFVGTSIVENGGLAAFIVQNGGSGYLSTDTIAISGPGATQATGNYTFTTNPTNGQTIILNGVTWTFVSTSPTGNETLIGLNTGATITQLAIDLSASAVSGISVANYSATGSVLNITYKTAGVTGNTYTLAAGTYGGTPSGATLTGGTAGSGGATASLVVGPQAGTYPSVVAYFQQRRVYANSLNNPDTYWMSQPGAFLNFDTSIPITDADAITGSPWSQQVNGIQFLVSMPGGLVVLTGNGAWQVSGGTSSAITPSDQTATPQAYNGCSPTVVPITINYDIIYVQSKGSIARDLSYNFFVNIYTGTDMTVLSNQLFDSRLILQWTWAEEPFKIVWAVRNDGALLSLTYLKEQDIYAWARHDTNGLFVSVTSVTEPPVDAVYVVTQRYVKGAWRYYSERMNNRSWQNVEDSYCVDSGLTWPMVSPNATLTAASASGDQNITGVNLISGGTGYTAPTAQAIDHTGAGSGATFSVTIMGGVITAITPILAGENYAVGTKIIVNDTTGMGAIAQPIITNNVAFSASSGVFTSGSVGQVIRVGGGKATVTSYIDSEHVIANITQAITATVPNSPDNIPVPAAPGTWTITPTTEVVSGLNHLEGMTVAILADGSVVPNQVVTNGQITLPQPYSAITIGLPYVCQLQTMYLDPQSEPGSTPQNRRKNIVAIGSRVQNSRGLQVGSNQPDASTQPNGATVPWTNMIEQKQRNATQPAGTPIQLETGDFHINISPNWDTNGQAAFQQIYPLPCQILASIIYYAVGDTPG